MSVAITGAGESTSWLQQKSNVARIFSEFVQQDDELSDDWNLLSANTLCAAPVYERFTGFLVYTYLIPKGVKNAGLPLACQSVLNYIGSLLNRAASRFKTPGCAVFISEFFFCLDLKSGSESAKWLQKLKKKVIRVTFERDTKAGAQLDNSESAHRPANPLPLA
jgi:hypothetical protein